MASAKQRIADFMIFGVCASIIAFVSSPVLDQNYALFFERDLAISKYKKTDDIVPTNELYIICLSISLTIIVLTFFAPSQLIVNTMSCISQTRHYEVKSRLVLVFVLGLGFIVSCLSANAVVSVIKQLVGRARPIALYHCNYLGYRIAVDSGNFTNYDSLTTFGKVGDPSNCWDLDNKEDAFSSFPSGHASFSFSSMCYITLLLRKILGTTDKEYFSWRGAVSFIPVVICTWISVTRVIDFKHHVEDVLTGAIIGAVCALFSWWNIEDLLHCFVSIVVGSSPLSSEMTEGIVAEEDVFID